MKYFARSKFLINLVYKKCFGIGIASSLQVKLFFVKGGRISFLGLNELREKLLTTIIPGNFVNKL